MIKNISKNTIISKDYLYKTGFSKTKGLLLNTKPETIVFNTRFGIHTFFLKFPIDLLVLNRKKEVKFLKKSVAPNKIIFWNPKYDLVLEMPTDSIKNSKTKIGDIIDIKL